MKMMLLVEMDTAAGNAVINEGRMKEVMDGILGKLKPEAAYFHARGGRRAMTLVVDCADEASLPSLAEPFWLELSASVESFPVMDAAQLAEGLSRLAP